MYINNDFDVVGDVPDNISVGIIDLGYASATKPNLKSQQKPNSLNSNKNKKH